MVIKSRARFGASRELEGLDPGRGEIWGWTPKSAKSVLDFGSRPGSGRGSGGSWSGRIGVEVESRSSQGSELGSLIGAYSSAFSTRGGKQPTTLLDRAPIRKGPAVVSCASSDREGSQPLLSE